MISVSCALNTRLIASADSTGSGQPIRVVHRFIRAAGESRDAATPASPPGREWVRR